MNDGKRILVTGGTRGIGRAVVRALIRRGDQVAFTYREDVDGAAGLLEEGAQAACRTDAGRYGEARDTVRFLTDLWGGLDGLVCNAGQALTGLFTEQEPEDWAPVLDTNLYGVLHYCRAVAPDMIRQKAGSIVTVASVWGEEGASCEAVYSASKGAVISFSRALARELGPSGVRVNCVSPGVIDTGMNRFLDPAECRALEEAIPLGRFGTPEEAADAVLFLLGESARYVTGSVLRVSGGF